MSTRTPLFRAFRFIAKSFIKRANKVGDKMSSCRTPTLHWNQWYWYYPELLLNINKIFFSWKIEKTLMVWLYTMQIVKMLHNDIHEQLGKRTYIFLAYFYRPFKLKISSRSLKSEKGRTFNFLGKRYVLGPKSVIRHIKTWYHRVRG